VRLIVLLLGLGCLSLPLAAQVSETGGDSDESSSIPNAPRAQPANTGGDDGEGTGAPRAQPAGPGAVQDEEAARQKLLKAADQIDLMESNSESNKETLATIQAQLAKLQDANTALKQQVSTLQDTAQQQQNALDRMRADQAKARQALIDEVAALVAEKSAAHRSRHVDDETAPPAHDDTAPPPPHKTEPPDSLAPPPDAEENGSSSPAHDAAAESSPETHHPHKGYMYVVKAHETLSLIVDAFRQQGVKVTVTEVRKANSLTSKSVLHVGQKLFIPRPGT
jgi:hypothetical protein